MVAKLTSTWGAICWAWNSRANATACGAGSTALTPRRAAASKLPSCAGALGNTFNQFAEHQTPDPAHAEGFRHSSTASSAKPTRPSRTIVTFFYYDRGHYSRDEEQGCGMGSGKGLRWQTESHSIGRRVRTFVEQTNSEAKIRVSA